MRILQAMEELKQANLDEEGVEAMHKLYTEVRAEEEKAREAKDKEAGSHAEGLPRPSQVPEALKIGGLAHGVISRLLVTLKLMYEVYIFGASLRPSLCIHLTALMEFCTFASPNQSLSASNSASKNTW